MGKSKIYDPQFRRECYCHKCKECGNRFNHPARNKQFCLVCDRIRKEREQEFRKSQKNKKDKSTLKLPIKDFLKIIEQYNSTNKTNYTYGQFVELLRIGKIKL